MMALALKPGDNVFYCDNAPNHKEYGAKAMRVIESLGLVPLVYMGAGKKVNESSLRREIQADLYAAKVAYIRLGGQNVYNNWALLVMPRAERSGIQFIFYTSGEHVNFPATVVRSPAEFEAAFRCDLENLLK